jgi:hypothetical protein
VTARILAAISFALDRFAERLHDIARRMRGEPEPEGPHVCPGCYAVAEACAPWCPDAAMERDSEARRWHEPPYDDPEDEDDPGGFASDDLPF